MAKREKILIGFMAIAVLYGIYALLLSSPSTDQPAEVVSQVNPPQDIAQKVAVEISKEALTSTEELILKLAEQKWEADPFLGHQLSTTLETAQSEESAKYGFQYTGFIAAGNKSLAIINGMEYQVGEQMETGGYMVLSIDPEKVVLQNPGKRGLITVPFTE